MSVFDGLISPAAVGQSIFGAFQQGQAEGRERQVRGALSDWAMNPDDSAAQATLARLDPATFIGLREKQEKRAQELAARQLQVAAAKGDPTAKAQLAGVDIDAWAKLDAATQKRVKDQVDYVGQAALAVKQLPLEQRAAAWDHYVDEGEKLGYTDLASYRGHYSPEALDSAIANAGLVKDFLGTQEIHWHQQGEAPSFATDSLGRPIGSANPATIASGSSGPSQAHIDALRQHPDRAAEFDAKFGQGAAARIIGGGASGNAGGGFPQ